MTKNIQENSTKMSKNVVQKKKNYQQTKETYLCVNFQKQRA